MRFVGLCLSVGLDFDLLEARSVSSSSSSSSEGISIISTGMGTHFEVDRLCVRDRLFGSDRGSEISRDWFE